MANNLVESVSVRVPPPLQKSITGGGFSDRSSITGGGFYDRCSFSKPVLSRSYSHFDRSAVPLRFMYFRNETWCNFSNEVVQILRTGFLERKPIIETSIDGAKYIFDLRRMLHIEYSTGNCRSISWIDESSNCFFPTNFFSEEELNRSDCVDSNDNTSCNCKNKNNNLNPNIAIEVKIDRIPSKRKREEEAEVSSSNKVAAVGNGVAKGAAVFPNTIEVKIDRIPSKRKREEEAEVSSSNKVAAVGNGVAKGAAVFPNTIEVKIDRIPSKRKREEEAEVSSSNKVAAVGNGVAKGAAVFPNTMRLRETEINYYLVKNHFIKGIMKVDPLVTVTSIYQCMWGSQFDKTRYHVFQKQNESVRAARGTSNVVYAWFGASAKLVERILLHGFGLPSKLPATDAYGVGVYLTPVELPHVSETLADADDNGVKHLILCRVILGNVEKVEAGSEQHLPSSVKFDTGSDDPKNPKWYVVWPNIASMHILPEFVVSFRHSTCMQGQPRPLSGVKYSLETLFSKIKNSLPPAKVREILTTYSTYKAGMTTKVVFIRKLREIAGDEVLKSAIREINASG